jgi:alkylhydroperoxidase family enzyme
MNDRHAESMQRMVDAILTTRGDTETALRRAIEARAAAYGGRSDQEKAAEVSANLITYVDKVALHAYKTTDADIEKLLQAGYSEDAIFEITLSAALGAGLARLERGLAALKGAADATEER